MVEQLHKNRFAILGDAVACRMKFGSGAACSHLLGRNRKKDTEQLPRVPGCLFSQTRYNVGALFTAEI